MKQFFLLLLLSLGLISSSFGADSNVSKSSLYQQLMPAIVALSGSSDNPIGATGTLIGPRYVLTCRHGNINMDRIYVRNVYNQVIEGRLIDSSDFLADSFNNPDVGIIELSRPFDYYSTAVISDKIVPPGESVFTIGQPGYLTKEGYGWAITTGHKENILTYKDENNREYSLDAAGAWQTDQLFSMKMAAGYSGGPIFNSRGEIISIHSAGSPRWEIYGNLYGLFNHRADPLKFYNPAVEVWTRQFNGVGGGLVATGPKLKYIHELVSRNNINLGGKKPGGKFDFKDDIIYDDENLKQLFEPLVSKIDPSIAWTGILEGQMVKFSPGGSGLFITPKLFLTVAHGLGDFGIVLLPNGEAHPGTTLYWDNESDLALGIIEGQVENYYTKFYGDSLRIGDPLAMTGNPGDAAFSLGGWLTSAGYIKKLNVAVGGTNKASALKAYYTSVPVQGGASGSAAYDQKGRIVGFLSGGASGVPTQLKVIDHDPNFSEARSLPFMLRNTTFSSTASVINFLQGAAKDPSVKPYIMPTLELMFDQKPANLKIQKNTDNSADLEYRTSFINPSENVNIKVGSGSFFKSASVSDTVMDLGINAKELISMMNANEPPEFNPPGLFFCGCATKEERCSKTETKKYCILGNKTELEQSITFAQTGPNRECVKGDSWGIDNKGLWIAKSCRAYFLDINSKDASYNHSKVLLESLKNSAKSINEVLTKDGLLDELDQILIDVGGTN